MRFALTGLLAVLLISAVGCKTAQQATLSPAPSVLKAPPGEYIQHIRDVSVVVAVRNGDGEVWSRGTGVVVKKNGKAYVWTAHHVIDNVADIMVVRPAQLFGATKTTVISEAMVLAYSTELDVAVLEVKEPDKFEASCLFDFTTIHGVGTPIYHVGAVNGRVGTVTNGIISRYSIAPGNSLFIESTCLIYMGSSGGGFFSTEGKVVGLVRAISTKIHNSIDRSGISVGVSSIMIYAWARRQGLLYAIDY